jgi:nucleoside-diphosphate-sugar epimerase
MLITGANGMIGSDLVNFFSKKNKVFAIFRNHNSISKSLKNKNIIWIKHDLKKKIYNKIKPKIIIHCAGVHSFSKKNHYNDFIESNIIGLSNVLDFASRNKVKKIIHISSIDVYGNIKSSRLDEASPSINPSLIGCTKLLMEKMISKEKIDYLNIRIPGVVGYLVNNPAYPWISNITNKMKEDKQIEIYNGDNLFNNILDTLEIFKFINKIKNRSLKKQIVNLSATKPVNLKKLILYIKYMLNSKSNVLVNEKKSKHFIISNKKLSKLYNYKASTTENIIKRYIKNFII